MQFDITRESNLDAPKSKVVQDLTNNISFFLSDKDYGSSIQSFIIGMICVKPEFESFVKVRKPKYIEDKTEIVDGESYHILRQYTYDIKLDWKRVMSLTDEMFCKILVEEIIKSLTHFDNLPKKIKNFDVNKLKLDLVELLRISTIV